MEKSLSIPKRHIRHTKYDTIQKCFFHSDKRNWLVHEYKCSNKWMKSKQWIFVFFFYSIKFTAVDLSPNWCFYLKKHISIKMSNRLIWYVFWKKSNLFVNCFGVCAFKKCAFFIWITFVQQTTSIIRNYNTIFYLKFLFLYKIDFFCEKCD